MVKLNGCNVWLKMMTYWTNTILFGIKSVLILKTKIKSYGEEAIDFHDKEIPVRSNHNYLAVINLDSALKKLCSHWLKRTSVAYGSALNVSPKRVGRCFLVCILISIVPLKWSTTKMCVQSKWEVAFSFIHHQSVLFDWNVLKILSNFCEQLRKYLFTEV